METATLNMTPRNARTEAERYAKCENLTDTDRAIMKAYKSIAHGGKVIDLLATLKKGGLFDNGLPKLAICRADADRCNLTIQYGRIKFTGNAGYYQKKLVDLPNFSTLREGQSWAKAPYIPPYVRRKNMSDLFVMWEATWQAPPKGDPFLLERIDENLYRVVAAWDLTPVEASVLT